MKPRGRQEDPEAATVAQATLRLRSELQCERVIRLAHWHGVASATAYRGPTEGDSPIFVMLLDGPVQMDRFLPELREIVPEAPISVIRETVEHAAPSDFLRAGVLRSRPFAADVGHLGWVFAGGGLGAGARLLVESMASKVSAGNDVFPWGTMLVNVAGSFAIAVLGALLFERFMEERERLFWVLGFLGSFTTFSSFVLQTTETWDLSPFLGALYGGGSLVLGMLAAFLGLKVAGRVFSWHSWR